MNISFRSKKLQKTCNSDKELLKEFGKVCARKFRTRLDDLNAASSLEVLRNLPGRCHELKGGRKGHFSLDLENPYRLIFESTGDGIQMKADGGLDWSSVKAVEIIGVEDTHE
ncbi:MAG: killer suppression protein [Proteobacteria bacterium]|nr:MAG: killer suppression protein [Pseudomonadota bacterium]